MSDGEEPVRVLSGALATESRPPLTAVTGLEEKGTGTRCRSSPAGRTGNSPRRHWRLKPTPTSRITVVTTGDGGIGQRVAKAEDFSPAPIIAVVHAEGKDGPVLLTAVAHPKPGPDPR
jgi:hypothetical protein